MTANFYLNETNGRLFRLVNNKPLNKYFWEKEKAETLERLSKLHNIPKTAIWVEEEPYVAKPSKLTKYA